MAAWRGFANASFTFAAERPSFTKAQRKV